MRAELARSAELRLMLSKAGAAAVVQVGLAVDRPRSLACFCQALTCWDEPDPFRVLVSHWQQAARHSQQSAATDA